MKKKGFTLIELLIVVAIIAILAAIAVPNFLEAQTRSKVSRTFADMRTVITALESYAVDYNHYPETRNPYRLTTPNAFITNIPRSPWKERIWPPALGYEYLYVSTWGTLWGTNPDDIEYDYVLYTGKTDIGALRWELKSNGPNNVDDRELYALFARIYDPTNGTISLGDIVVFNNHKGSMK
ncbi:MAG TPA: prepilin-type N-terminal cleavage/methylation domain-containing protein [Candidatus Sumerlaeota bacterium]|nr:prepilin-type N-terminal cleavage/methylation domain-containing protein [Candidatus Sumerlaeota bacterium]